ncbi:MAG: FAD-dependent oxidoreductase [Armatimonadetes bacterium]|nr:FAD-dependent oxidoreductase [Armatimonadota bacterium]
MASDVDVIVIGGGVAGVSACATLVSHGLSVALIEKRPMLGGRASSFTDTRTGDIVDVCRHITLGCCTAFESLLTDLGVLDRLRYLDALTFQDRAGRRADIRASCFPAPFHLLRSLLALPWLTARDKLAACRLMANVASAPNSVAHGDFTDFGQWARRNGATDRVERMLVQPLITSACNELADNVALHHGLLVCREALVRPRTGYRMGLLSDPLATVFTEPACSLVRASGGIAMLRTTVSAVAHEAPGHFVATLGSGEALSGRGCVLAVPYGAVMRLAPLGAVPDTTQRNLRSLESAPIVATHLWFDEPINCPEALGLLERDTDWVFGGKPSDARRSGHTYITTVTSANRELASKGAESILSGALVDLREALGRPRPMQPYHARVVVEHRATFVPSPGIEEVRPANATTLRGLALAGEWTATGWPSTMESAARSGRSAAALVLRDLSE